MSMPTDTEVSPPQSAAETRLIEACAACLCWAEWPGLDRRTDDPWSYWQKLPASTRKRYLPDARKIAAMMRSDQYALVPARATEAMRQAGIEAGRGLRSQAGAAHVHEEMVKAARAEMRWRSGEAESQDAPP